MESTTVVPMWAWVGLAVAYLILVWLIVTDDDETRS